jgi:opacity protein-like surface antigen
VGRGAGEKLGVKWGVSNMKTSALGALVLAATSATVQAGDWTYDLSANLWLNDTLLTTDTPFGPVSGELSFADALQALDFAFMGTVEARNGPWGVIGDLLYFKLSASGDSPNGVLFSGATIASTITVVSGYLAYRVYEDDQFAMDLGGGFRSFGADLDTTLTGVAAPSQSFANSSDWVAPILAGRLRMNFSEQWFGTVLLDAGGFTGDNQTWQALATVGYRLNERWTLQGGYRYLDVTQDGGARQTSLVFSGPILGVTYRF